MFNSFRLERVYNKTLKISGTSNTDFLNDSVLENMNVTGLAVRINTGNSVGENGNPLVTRDELNDILLQIKKGSDIIAEFPLILVDSCECKIMEINIPCFRPEYVKLLNGGNFTTTKDVDIFFFYNYSD